MTRCPFIDDAASEQRYAIASAISSAGVNVEKSLSGLSARIAGVTMAPTTTMFAVAPVPLKRSASASVHVSEAAFAAAYDGVRMRWRLRLSRRNEDEPSAPALHQRRRERLRRVLNRSDEERAEEVPVLERCLLDGGAAAPAADEVDEPVHSTAVPGGQICCPRFRRNGIEEIDDVGLDRRVDLRRESVESFLIASADTRA